MLSRFATSSTGGGGRKGSADSSLVHIVHMVARVVGSVHPQFGGLDIRDGRVPPFSAVYYVYRVPSTPIISFICSIFEILN